MNYFNDNIKTKKFNKSLALNDSTNTLRDSNHHHHPPLKKSLKHHVSTSYLNQKDSQHKLTSPTYAYFPIHHLAPPPPQPTATATATTTPTPTTATTTSFDYAFEPHPHPHPHAHHHPTFDYYQHSHQNHSPSTATTFFDTRDLTRFLPHLQPTPHNQAHFLMPSSPTSTLTTPIYPTTLATTPYPSTPTTAPSTAAPTTSTNPFSYAPPHPTRHTLSHKHSMPALTQLYDSPNYIFHNHPQQPHYNQALPPPPPTQMRSLRNIKSNSHLNDNYINYNNNNSNNGNNISFNRSTNRSAVLEDFRVNGKHTKPELHVRV